MAASMIWHTEEYMEEYALRWVGSRLIGLGAGPNYGFDQENCIKELQDID